MGIPSRIGTRRPLGARLLAPLLVLALATSCTSLEARVHNLRELHEADGRPRYRAALMSEWEFALRRGFSSPSLDAIGLDYRDKKPSEVEDPGGESLNNLVRLARFDPDGVREGALQTEMFAWLAVDDRYVLARERAVLALSAVARRLGLDAPFELDPERETPSADEVAEWVAELVAAAGDVLEDPADPQAAAVLAGVCNELGARELTVQGGRRVLAAAAALLDAGGDELEPLAQLVEEVEWQCVGEALTLALDDPHPVVRAAALRAWVQGTDNRVPEVVAAALADEAREVSLLACRLIRVYGLPRPRRELSPVDLAEYYESWYARLLELVWHPEGSVGVAACRALGRVTDSGLRSLRGEDWAAWWRREYGSDELELPDALEAGLGSESAS